MELPRQLSRQLSSVTSVIISIYCSSLASGGIYEEMLFSFYERVLRVGKALWGLLGCARYPSIAGFSGLYSTIFQNTRLCNHLSVSLSVSNKDLRIDEKAMPTHFFQTDNLHGHGFPIQFKVPCLRLSRPFRMKPNTNANHDNTTAHATQHASADPG